MAIEGNRIAVGTANKNGQNTAVVPPLIAFLFPVDPSITPTFADRDTGQMVSPTPWEGRLAAFESQDGSHTAQLYIARSGTWVSVRMLTGHIDPRTGKTYDPLAVFYNNLAN